MVLTRVFWVNNPSLKCSQNFDHVIEVRAELAIVYMTITITDETGSLVS